MRRLGIVLAGVAALWGWGASLHAADSSRPGQLVITDSGLEYVDLTVGTGREAGLGDTATVQYTGWLQDGTKFDSSYDHGKPFSFRIGAGQVIKGWDEGVTGMKVGGKRKLTIPPHLGYGARGAGGLIPPNAKLTFEVELLTLR
jgi:FKBP-type peptidyl-prolyl cis-trans isomerase FkpA